MTAIAAPEVVEKRVITAQVSLSQVKAEKKYAIGVDLGATNLRVVLATRDGTFLAKVSERTTHEGTGLSIAHQIISMIEKVLEKAGVNIREVEGVGIGSIGPLDLRRGVVVKPANLPFTEIPLRDPIESEFGLPVYILNDCTTAVVGEKMYGDGVGLSNLVYITISTGIGGGAYVDGNLLIGKDGNAVEIGHTVVDMEGRLICSCGKPGHWEAYASGRSIPKYVKLLAEEKPIGYLEKSMLYEKCNGDWEKLTAKDVYDAAKQGDFFALEVVERVGKINAIGIANVIDVYDPSLITLGGSVVLNNPKLVLEPIKRYAKNYIVNRMPEIKITRLGGDIVLYGAVGLVFSKVKVECKD